MKLLILLALSISAFANVNGKLKFFKGDVKVIRNQKYLKKVKRGINIKDGDIIQTGSRSIAIVKHVRTTLKVISNSKLLINFPKDSDVDATVAKGGVIVNFINKMKHNGKKDYVKPPVNIRTRTVSMGVRGTKFMAFVGKDNNSVLTVNRGKVNFKADKSQRSVDVAKGISTMTNQNDKTIKPRNFGINDKVNWEMDDTKKNLLQSKKFFSHMSKIWQQYKKEQEMKWNSFKNEQDEAWKNWKKTN